jgi:hypothetical protein
MAVTTDLMDFIYPTNISMDQDMLHTSFVSEIILSWNPQPEWYRCNTSYESIDVPEGYEKPPKEEFEAKLQELIDAQPLKELRTKRNTLLADVDWVTLKAYSTDTPVPDEWKTYMQALRDLPSNTEDPANPVWPVAPQ